MCVAATLMQQFMSFFCEPGFETVEQFRYWQYAIALQKFLYSPGVRFSKTLISLSKLI